MNLRHAAALALVGWYLSGALFLDLSGCATTSGSGAQSLSPNQQSNASGNSESKAREVLVEEAVMGPLGIVAAPLALVAVPSPAEKRKSDAYKQDAALCSSMALDALNRNPQQQWDGSCRCVVLDSSQIFTPSADDTQFQQIGFIYASKVTDTKGQPVTEYGKGTLSAGCVADSRSVTFRPSMAGTPLQECIDQVNSSCPPKFHW